VLPLHTTGNQNDSLQLNQRFWHLRWPLLWAGNWRSLPRVAMSEASCAADRPRSLQLPRLIESARCAPSGGRLISENIQLEGCAGGWEVRGSRTNTLEQTHLNTHMFATIILWFRQPAPLLRPRGGTWGERLYKALTLKHRQRPGERNRGLGRCTVCFIRARMVKKAEERQTHTVISIFLKVLRGHHRWMWFIFPRCSKYVGIDCLARSL